MDGQSKGESRDPKPGSRWPAYDLGREVLSFKVISFIQSFYQGVPCLQDGEF